MQNPWAYLLAVLTTTLIHPALAGGTHDHAHTHAPEAGAAGRPGDPDAVSRTIEVVMNDRMRFVPERIRLSPGETVRFRIRNEGRLRHEFVLGSAEELAEHARQMRMNPHMGHDDPGSLSLGPGESGEVVWRFDRPGRVDYACLIPGHFEAGMTGTIVVGAAPDS